MSRPYVEIQCLDCGVAYEPESGCCPACGSANCSYDSGAMRDYQEFEREHEEWERERHRFK